VDLWSFSGGGTFYIRVGRRYGLEGRFTEYMGTLAAEIACETGGSAGGGDSEPREENCKDLVWRERLPGLVGVDVPMSCAVW
jgi:hypothetical protein